VSQRHRVAIRMIDINQIATFGDWIENSKEVNLILVSFSFVARRLYASLTRLKPDSPLILSLVCGLGLNFIQFIFYLYDEIIGLVTILRDKCGDASKLKFRFEYRFRCLTPLLCLMLLREFLQFVHTESSCGEDVILSWLTLQVLSNEYGHRQGSNRSKTVRLARVRSLRGLRLACSSRDSRSLRSRCDSSARALAHLRILRRQCSEPTLLT